MENINWDELKLNNMCRTCLNQSAEMCSIFNHNSSVCIFNILTEVSSVKIEENDGLPVSICTVCLEKAEKAYEFKMQCLRTDMLFRKIMATITKLEYLEEDHNLIEKLKANNNIFKDDNLYTSSPSDQLITDKKLNYKLQENKFEIPDSTNVYYENCSDIDESTNKDVSNQPNEEHLIENNEIIKSEFSTNKTVIKENQNSNLARNNCSDNNESSETTKIEEKNSEKQESDSCLHPTTINKSSHNMEDGRFMCNQCGKSFRQYSGFCCHIRSHRGEQPYACKVCNKRYRQSASLTAHMRIHTGQRPFLCSVCGKGFRQQPDLGYHMRTHTKEKPYMCTVCGKRMSMSCHLVQHMRTHTGEKPFACLECGKAFASTTRLKRHEIIHTGEKPYVCNVCSKAFNRLSTLRIHALTHTDVRPHRCEVCGRGFIQAHCLRNHMNTHRK